MSSKHTPGPWTTIPGEPYVYASEVNIAVVRTDTMDDRIGAEEWPANVALIAAAPDLLAACEAMLAWVDSPDDEEPDWGALGEATQLVRDAIAHAGAR